MSVIKGNVGTLVKAAIIGGAIAWGANTGFDAKLNIPTLPKLPTAPPSSKGIYPKQEVAPYISPDGTLGWIIVEPTNEPITKVIVLDANGNEKCRGYQFTPAMGDYNKDFDVATDGVADNRTRITQQGIIEKFCGVNGYLFYKTPDTSKIQIGTLDDFVAYWKSPLFSFTPEVLGYSYNPEDGMSEPVICWTTEVKYDGEYNI